MGWDVSGVYCVQDRTQDATLGDACTHGMDRGYRVGSGHFTGALQGRRERISEIIRSYPGAFFFFKVLIVWSISEGQKVLGGKDICRGVEKILSR
jgi:hypothetical protein